MAKERIECRRYSDWHHGYILAERKDSYKIQWHITGQKEWVRKEAVQVLDPKYLAFNPDIDKIDVVGRKVLANTGERGVIISKEYHRNFKVLCDNGKEELFPGDILQFVDDNGEPISIRYKEVNEEPKSALGFLENLFS